MAAWPLHFRSRCGEKNRVHRIVGPITHERSSPDHHHNRFVAGQRTIAVRVREGKSPSTGPGLFWLGGFKSDMGGTKAEALDRWAGRARPRLRAV